MNTTERLFRRIMREEALEWRRYQREARAFGLSTRFFETMAGQALRSAESFRDSANHIRKRRENYGCSVKSV